MTFMRDALEVAFKIASSIDTLDETRPAWLLERLEEPDQDSRYYRFLYELSSILRPSLTIETGTRNGISAIHLALGNPDGKVVTVDIDPQAKVRVDSEKIRNLTAVTSDSVKAVPRILALAGSHADIVFFDSDHRYDVISSEYTAYRPLVKLGGIMLFDDIHLNPEMKRFWDRLADPKLELNHLHKLRGAGFGAAVKIF